MIQIHSIDSTKGLRISRFDPTYHNDSFWYERTRDGVVSGLEPALPTMRLNLVGVPGVHGAAAGDPRAQVLPLTLGSSNRVEGDGKWRVPRRNIYDKKNCQNIKNQTL